MRPGALLLASYLCENCRRYAIANGSPTPQRIPRRGSACEKVRQDVEAKHEGFSENYSCRRLRRKESRENRLSLLPIASFAFQLLMARARQFVIFRFAIVI